RIIFVIFALLAVQFAEAGVTIQHWVAPSGAKVYFVESRVLPILDVQVDFAAGSMFDPPGKTGLAGLTRGLLGFGAGNLDENAIADRLADLGAGIGGGSDSDRANVSLRTLSAPDKRGPALDLLRLVLQSPRFEPAIFEREKIRSVSALKEALTRPESIASRAFSATLYPDHAYGRLTMPEGLAALKRDDAVAFYKNFYHARNAGITIVGDVSRAEAEKIAEALSVGLPPGGASTLPPAPKLPQASTRKIPHPATQAHILLGMPAIERGNPDFFPLLVGNYTLGGGGFMSRLMKEVRDKRGFAYSVYSYFSPLRQAGPFQIGLQTKRAQADEALKVTRDVLDDFLKNGPSEAELAAAKANLTGSFPLRLDSNRKILENVANIGFYGLPLDYLDTYQQKVNAVTVAAVRQAFAKHVRTENLVTIMVAAD
ncbi:MAG: M16 family metallopeptidase, partial [Betaproteobacteria bacterium]